MKAASQSRPPRCSVKKTINPSPLYQLLVDETPQSRSRGAITGTDASPHKWG